MAGVLLPAAMVALPVIAKGADVQRSDKPRLCPLT